MTSTDFTQDGSVLWATFATPGRGLARAVSRRRVATALIVATFATLASAAVISPRLDVERAAGAKLGAELTEHEREQALATARKLETVKQWARAATFPTLMALAATCFLALGFRVGAARPGFKDTLTVTAHGLLPIWLKQVLLLPAVLAHPKVTPGEVDSLLPSSLAALVPSASPPALAALGALDFFSLWAFGLIATGMATAAGTSRRRAFIITGVLFAAQIALLKVVPAAAGGGGP